MSRNQNALRCLLAVAAGLLVCGFAGVSVAADANMKRPNIVYILADDLGIGDVGAFNPDCKIKTPSMDRLAAEGMRFTDAHSGSAVCTPTRYGVLTGRYSWRTRLQSGVCWGYSVPLIAEGRMTVASMLKQQGYNTGCIGKWHLGLNWALKDPKKVPSDNSKETWDNIDFTKPISAGPNQVGFDHFFGISASLDMHPYVYIENDRVSSVPEKIVPASGGKQIWRAGPIGDDFQHDEILDRLTEEAVSYIGSQKADKPFFLYFPLTAPHTPIVPNETFRDKSGLNEWGDFVMQVDWTIGRVMQAVESNGLAENTLFIVTSDNGATPQADFPALKKKGHDPSYLFRGHKADIFEGGHRVAFLARWPAVIKPGSTSNETICHTDLLATAADITGLTLPATAGEDSVSMLPLLKQSASGAVREATVHHSINGNFAIRRGNWKLCFCPGSGGWSEPRPQQARKDKLPEVQLYDLSKDIAESDNVQAAHPEVVQELAALMQKYVDEGRSTTGKRQKNDRSVLFEWKK
ncbi:MAG: arylsulfatase [Planctomycetota bacterium]|nr:arylsulfatase [Planctomycetota bacterium]MDA1252120.1 arylsulfatase [Planctomycetota bacterium]